MVWRYCFCDVENDEAGLYFGFGLLHAANAVINAAMAPIMAMMPPPELWARKAAGVGRTTDR
jgi:hypothetical protein